MPLMKSSFPSGRAILICVLILSAPCGRKEGALSGKPEPRRGGSATPAVVPPRNSGQKAGGEAGWRALDLPKPLDRLLEVGDFGATPAGHRIVALSFLADACVAEAQRDADLHAAALACVARCLELGAKTRPAQKPETVKDGLWLSHFNLMLGAHDRLGPCAEPARHEAIATTLARRSLGDPTFHVASYANLPYRWPADQTATLASLARYDRAHATRLAEEPAKRWREQVLAHAMDKRLELPWSEATGKAQGARDPRGCALSWQTRFLVEFDPELGAVWWRRYKDKFLVDGWAVVGFREWPPGRERRADTDSGPIVQGVGAAATALGIAAARVMGDRLLAARLEGTAVIVEGFTASDPDLAKAAATPLAAAIRYLGQKAREREP
jgi:hypothetical protein